MRMTICTRKFGSLATACAALILWLAGTLMPSAGHADTVASLLGNFTINQFCGLDLAARRIDVHYVVVFGQLPALRELHLADSDGNGVTSQAERDAYVGRLAPSLGEGLRLDVDGVSVPLRATRWTSSLPTEQGGFSLRLDIDFTADLPAAAGGPATGEPVHSLNFANEDYAGRMGWHEIVVHPTAGITVFDTNSFSTSLTGALGQALRELPANGPLDERVIHLRFGGMAPPHAELLGARPGTVAADRPADSASDTAWITQRTRQLVDAISRPRLEPRVALLALLGALLLGGVHALSPGHGKTIVGAYLIGSRGTPRHALILGLTVTITHTVGVFVLGFATLYASRFIVPERLFPVLSLLSAVLVLGMGVVLLYQRGMAARRAAAAAGSAAAPPAFRRVSPATPARGSRGFILAPTAQFVDATLHSHGGGPLHSHLPPGAAGEKVTWRSLLTLGISGGLVPCPSAMVLLLAAVALNKTAYGMLLVVAFSVGLAITLTLVGLAFLYARNRFRKPGAAARWPYVLPVLSAGAITLVGLVLCVGALRSFSP